MSIAASQDAAGILRDPRPLRDHLFELSCLLHSPEVFSAAPELDIMGCGEWLETAAGIKNVDFDVSELDASIMMCGLAADHRADRDEMLGKFTTALVRFNLTWTGFEILAKNLSRQGLVLPKRNRRPTVDLPCAYITSRVQPEHVPPNWSRTYEHLKELVLWSDSLGSKFSGEFSQHPDLSFQAMGLRALSQLRNAFVHGKASLPDHQETSRTDFHLIDVSSRIVLYSIQMILSARFKDSPFKVDFVDGHEEPVEIFQVLREIQYEPESLE